MNNREEFEAWVTKFRSNVILRRFENGEYVSAVTENYFNVWQAALAQANGNEQSQAQQPTNVWQQAIDDELINAHLGIAHNEVTREEAKAELNKLIAWHIDVAKYFDSQEQQTENLITRKAFICPACEGVDADSPVSSCHCMENDSNTFIEGTITYRLPPAPEGVK